MTKQYDNYADLITFTRASSGTYLDSDGVLKTATTNTPRIEYDADGNRLGLLIEEARTNVNSNSEAAGSHTPVNVSVQDNTGIAPDGQQTADLLVENTANGFHQVVPNYAQPASGEVYTASVFVKRGSGSRHFAIRLRDILVSPDNNNAIVYFNLDNGSVAGSSDVGDVTLVASSIVDVGNGWFRCSLSGSVANKVGNYQVNHFMTTSAGSGESYVGDGASSLLIWGFQMEAGSFATSYIGTSGATATRSADVASIPTSAFGYNQKAGTVVVEAIGSPDGFAAVTALQTSISNATSRISILQTYTVTYEILISDNGASQLQQFEGGFNVGSTYKVGIAFSENNSVSSFAGNLEPVDTSCSIPINISTLAIGYLASSSQLNGHIKSIQYYPRRLTNAQLVRLTS